jgi:hypothetical protein
MGGSSRHTFLGPSPVMLPDQLDDAQGRVDARLAGDVAGEADALGNLLHEWGVTGDAGEVCH